MIGTTIDRYRIVEQLGQGGMGVVYKARDTLLDRFVALKVLPPGKTSDPDRRQRFLQEAKAASALNHPGIVAVHDVLTVDDQDVLVMELVEGETLEALLARRRLPLSEALGLGIGTADAMARAHEAGIVHRDLKPANVMVTSDGVKVLDFGLAKLTETPFSHPEAQTLAQEESELTEERAVLGTVGWMSPEQTSGEPVDARSDVFAFGVLMYEMLTGQHPFRRGTILETIAAIREEEPEPPTAIVPALPPEVDRAVLRCLRKNPSRRWQSLSDLRAVLEDLKEDTDSGRRVVPGRKRAVGRSRCRSYSGSPASCVIAVAVAMMFSRGDQAGSRPLELHRLTYDAGASVVPAISPDGNLVAFSSDRAGDGGFDIWVRHINQPQPTRLTDHPADDWHPSFSPDGSRLIFRSHRDGGGIYIINALGGGLKKVAGPGIFPQFAPNGTEYRLLGRPGVDTRVPSPNVQSSHSGWSAGAPRSRLGSAPTARQLGPDLFARWPTGDLLRRSSGRSRPTGLVGGAGGGRRAVVERREGGRCHVRHGPFPLRLAAGTDPLHRRHDHRRHEPLSGADLRGRACERSGGAAHHRTGHDMGAEGVRRRPHSLSTASHGWFTCGKSLSTGKRASRRRPPTDHRRRLAEILLLPDPRRRPPCLLHLRRVPRQPTQRDPPPGSDDRNRNGAVDLSHSGHVAFSAAERRRLAPQLAGSCRWTVGHISGAHR